MALLLASASPIRRLMLEQAGVEHVIRPADIDEAKFKCAQADPEFTVRLLAEAKACAISVGEPGDWVIGSDSIVSIQGRHFDKPRDREEAANHLRHFSGRAMALSSAVALARDGTVDWRHAETAQLQVRALSESFIADYLDAEWPAVGGCVGVFRMEGRGVQLFEAIDGSYFTILGMPLLPLLGALRDRGLLAS